MTKIFPHCTISVGLAPLADYIYIYILENATALGSRIPPHAVLLQVNDNTPVKLKIIFAI